MQYCSGAGTPLGRRHLIKEYESLDKKLRELNGVRVDLVHGEHWLDFRAGGYRMRRTKTTPRGFKTDHNEFSADEISVWTAQALSLRADLHIFIRNARLD